MSLKAGSICFWCQKSVLSHRKSDVIQHLEYNLSKSAGSGMTAEFGSGIEGASETRSTRRHKHFIN
jgi:urease accessory protein UreH